MGVNAAAVVPGKKAASGGKVTDPCLSASSLRLFSVEHGGVRRRIIADLSRRNNRGHLSSQNVFSVTLVGDDAALRCNRTSVSPQLREMSIICCFFLFVCLVSEKCAAVCPFKRRKKATET